MPLEKGFRAGGTIRKSRFVVIDPSDDSTVLESGANGIIFGIAQEFSRDVPVDDIAGSGVNAAIDGDQIRVFGDGDAPVLLELGATVASGDHLRSTASGAGQKQTLASEPVGAIALESGVSGVLIRVQVSIQSKLHG